MIGGPHSPIFAWQVAILDPTGWRRLAFALHGNHLKVVLPSKKLI
jgi:hypothetical protein